MVKSNAFMSDGGTSILGNIWAKKIYDENNVDFYLNPYGKSVLHNVHGSRFFDRTDPSFYVDPAATSVINKVRATMFLDKDDLDFYLDPASTSILNEITVTSLTDRENSNYYLNPNSISKLHYVDANRFRDKADTDYYLDPASTSKLKNVWAKLYKDSDNTSYFLDPASTSNLNIVKATQFADATNPSFYVDPDGISTMFFGNFTGVKSDAIESNDITPAAPASAVSTIGTASDMYDHVWADVIHYNSTDQLSDERTKENIKDMQNPLNKLMALTAKTFDYKAVVPNYGQGAVSTGSRLKNRTGFIAQEVKKVIPEIVTFNEDFGLHTMNYVELIPMLVKGMQEQQKEIDALKKQLAK